MATKSDLGLGAQQKIVIDFLRGFALESITAEEIMAGREKEIMLAESKKGGLMAKVATLAQQGKDFSAVMVEFAGITVPAKLSLETAEALAKAQRESMLESEAKKLLAAMQLQDVVLPSAGDRKSKMDMSVEGCRLYLNGQQVHGFVARDNLVVVPSTTSLPATNGLHIGAITIWGKLDDAGRFVETGRTSDQFTSASGLMRLILGDKAQGVNGTPFTSNENARSGRVLSQEELAAIFA